MYQKLKLNYLLYLYQRAKVLKNNERFKKALKLYRKIIKLIPEDLSHELYLNTLYHLGDTYFHLHHFKKALQVFLEVKQYAKEKTTISQINQAITFCYREMRDLPRFIEYATEQLENEVDKATLLLDLSQAYRLLNQHHKAIEYAEDALELYEIKEEPSKVGYCYKRIGLVFIEEENYKKAIRCLEKTEAIYDKIRIHADEWCHLYQALEFSYKKIGYIDTAHFYKSKLNKMLKLKDA